MLFCSNENNDKYKMRIEEERLSSNDISNKQDNKIRDKKILLKSAEL